MCARTPSLPDCALLMRFYLHMRSCGVCLECGSIVSYLCCFVLLVSLASVCARSPSLLDSALSTMGCQYMASRGARLVFVSEVVFCFWYVVWP